MKIPEKEIIKLGFTKFYYNGGGFYYGNSDGITLEDIDEDELGHVDSLVNALWFIVDRIGPSTSRYSKKRVKISIEPGDKCEEENGN